MHGKKLYNRLVFNKHLKLDLKSINALKEAIIIRKDQQASEYGLCNKTSVSTMMGE